MSAVRLHLLTLVAIAWLLTIGHGQVSSSADEICLATFAKFTRNHTACLGPKRNCKITEAGLSSRDQKAIVDIHNYYRNLIASGNETQLGFPAASNMLKMEWDHELAYVAQMHANQCEFAHDCYECRKTDHHDTVGQNLYIYQTSQSEAETDWQFVIKEWYDEIKIAPPVVAQSFDLFNLNIGHFTQIAWSATNRVGCGIVTYNVNDGTPFKTAQLYTCNYAPGGNFLGEKMYEDGHPATQCPTRYSRSKRFTSLCEYTRAKVSKNLPPKKKKVTKVPKKVTPTTNEVVSNSWPVSSTTVHFEPSPSQTPSSPAPTFQQPSSQTPAFQQPSSQTPAFHEPEPSQAPAFQAPPPRKPLIITSSITAFTPSPSLAPSSSFPSSIPSSIPSAFPSSVFISTSTRRVSHKVTKKPGARKPKATKKPTQKKQQTPVVTQSSKRITNWWDKWSEQFNRDFRSSSTTRAPRKNQWTWTWSSTSNKPSSLTSTTDDQQTSRRPTRYLKSEMTHNGNLTHSIDLPI